ncbi:MAG: hypothetical protein AAGL17_00820, partial [Cyanobacteria bacterium J06576_12]
MTSQAAYFGLYQACTFCVPEPVLFAYLGAYFGLYFLCTCGVPPGFLLASSWLVFKQCHCQHFRLYGSHTPTLNRAI